MASPDEFAASLTAVAHKIGEVLARLVAAQERAEDAAGQLDEALEGSSQPLAESAVEHSHAAVERADEAMVLVEHAAKELAAYLAEVLGNGTSVAREPRSPHVAPDRDLPSGSPPSDFPSSKRLPHAENAQIDSRKLTDYALNPDHPVGRNKARVFESTTGFTRHNHESLLRQLHQGIREQPAELGRADQYGQRYTVDIPVRGPTGSATVRTGWLLESGSSAPRLLTLYVK
jgi:hypothetical protein